MLKNLIGAVLFTAAVLVFVNFVGDLAVRPQNGENGVSAPAPEMTSEPASEPTTEPAPQPAPIEEAVVAPEPEPEPQTAPEPAAVAQPAPQAATVALADGDADKGKKLFRRKCMACHTADKGDANRTGPNLWGIVDRPKAAVEGFNYSNTLKTFGGVWSEADIKSFIAGPRTFVPDTKMTFAGLKKESERADVLAYLKTLAD